MWAAKLPGSRGFQKIFAIKTMLPDASDDPEFESMFLDEARVAARIRHPNAVEIDRFRRRAGRSAPRPRDGVGRGREPRRAGEGGARHGGVRRPRRSQSALYAAFLRNFQANISSAACSQAIHRREHFRICAHELLLLVRKSFTIPTPASGYPSVAKIFPPTRKILVVHVCALRRLGSAEPFDENPPPSSPKLQSRHTAPHCHVAPQRHPVSLPEPGRCCS